MKKTDKSVRKDVDSSSFGARLAELREQNNLSRKEFMSKIRGYNVDSDSAYKVLHSWETEKHFPDITVLPKICEVLECDADYLVGRIDTKTHDIKDVSFLTGLSSSFIEKLFSEKHRLDHLFDDESLGSHIDDDYSFSTFPYPDSKLTTLELLYTDGIILDQIEEYLKVKQLDTNCNPKITVTDSNGDVSINGDSANIEISKQILLNNIRDRLNVVAEDLRKQSLSNKPDDFVNTFPLSYEDPNTVIS